MLAEVEYGVKEAKAERQVYMQGCGQGERRVLYGHLVGWGEG